MRTYRGAILSSESLSMYLSELMDNVIINESIDEKEFIENLLIIKEFHRYLVHFSLMNENEYNHDEKMVNALLDDVDELVSNIKVLENVS